MKSLLLAGSGKEVNTFDGVGHAVVHLKVSFVKIIPFSFPWNDEE